MKRDRYIKSMLSILVVVFVVPLSIHAQWSSDPLQNLGVAVVNGDQVVPKMAPTGDGGCYISWFDNRSGNYDMFLQRLNAQGEAQWTPNGLLISDHPQMSWLVDYDMTVDQDDNAIVVFSDIRNGTANDLDVFAYKIAPDGSFLWGPDGVGLSEAVNSDFEPAPKATVTAAGNVVVAWQKSGSSDVVCFQKLSSDGQILWGASGVVLTGGTGESLSAPDVVPAGNDDVIAIWKNSSGVPWAPTTLLYTQKFDSNGGTVWNPSGVLIYNLGNISAWTNPLIYSDGNDGAFYTWYDAPSLAEFNVWVQHVDAAGNLVFPLNGVPASTNSTDRLHMYPTLSYLPTGDELFVFWVEENGNQNQFGLYGQKFSPAGDRLWTDNGLEFIALGSEQIFFVNSMPAGESIYIAYFQSPSVVSTAVKAFRIDPDGSMLWNPVLLSSASLGNKDDLLLVVNTENRAFCCWKDERNDSGDIYAQNVNLDGSLGNPTTPTVTVTLTPYNPPIVIPANGGSFDFNIAVANTGGSAETFDIWTMATLPNGSQYGPIINVSDFTAPAGWSANRDRTQNVPGNAPAGLYTYDAYAGIYPDDVWGEDHFDFEKQADVEGSAAIFDWKCWGEDFGDLNAASSAVNPNEFRLLGACPNPFNPVTTISFTLPVASRVKLEVYDVAGRKVVMSGSGAPNRAQATPTTEYFPSGTHEITFDGSGLPSGVYIYRLTTGKFIASGKMVLMK